MTRRWVVLLVLLTASAWLAWTGPAPSTEVVDAAPKAPRARQVSTLASPATNSKPASSTGTPFVALLAQRDGAAEKHGGPMLSDPFAPRDWSPAPRRARAEVSLPPPVSSAPALPFSYLGKQRVDQGWEVFLSHDDRTLIVREGQSIDDGTYRVESIKPPVLVLTYTPLAQQQTIAIGGDE